MSGAKAGEQNHEGLTHLEGSFRLADHDVDGKYDFVLSLAGARSRFAFDGRAGAGETHFPATSIDRASSAFWPSQAGLTSIDERQKHTAARSRTDACPAIVLPRERFRALVATGTTTIIGLFEQTAAVDVEKIGNVKLLVAGKKRDVPALFLRGQGRRLILLPSTELPILLKRVEAMDCVVEIFALSALPKIDKDCRPPLKVLERNAHEAAREQDAKLAALSGASHARGLVDLSGHAVAARRERAAAELAVLLEKDASLVITVIDALDKTCAMRAKASDEKANGELAYRESALMKVLSCESSAAGATHLRKIADASASANRRQDAALHLISAKKTGRPAYEDPWLTKWIARETKDGEEGRRRAVTASDYRGGLFHLETWAKYFDHARLATAEGKEIAELVAAETSQPDPRWVDRLLPCLYEASVLKLVRLVFSAASEADQAAIFERLLRAMAGHDKPPGDMREIFVATKVATQAKIMKRLLDEGVKIPWPSLRSLIANSNPMRPRIDRLIDDQLAEHAAK